MSLVMYQRWKDGVFILTDTLACLSTYEPSSFQSKVWTLPHRNVVFAVRGAVKLGALFHDRINATPTCRDIEGVNEAAPRLLREIHAELADEGFDGHAQVFLFGFPTGADELVHYQYQDTRDYEPEQNDHTFCVAPGPATFELTAPQTREEIIDLATRIRDENDRDLAAPGRAVIGGDLFAVQFTSGSITTNHWHRFPDYDDTLRAIIALHKRRLAE